jgi:hypothetical protein
VNWSAELVDEVPTGVVRVTSTGPIDPRGATALMETGDVTVNEDAGTVPNFTAVAPERFAPDTVTAVPPETGPEDGLTALTEGGDGGELV